MPNKHTPGPWRVGQNLDGETAVFCKRRGKDGCICYGLYDENNEPSLKELEANAALIAAAPELLEALKALVQGLPEMETDESMSGGDVVEYLSAAWPNIKAAICKAEGDTK